MPAARRTRAPGFRPVEASHLACPDHDQVHTIELHTIVLVRRQTTMPRKVHDGIRKRCVCPRRQWPKCPHPWHFSLHHGGKEHRYSLDKLAHARGARAPTSKSEASMWRDRLRSEIRSGTFVGPGTPMPAAPVDVRLTFGDVCDQYLKRSSRCQRVGHEAGGRWRFLSTCCVGQKCPQLREQRFAWKRSRSIPSCERTSRLSDLAAAGAGRQGSRWCQRRGGRHESAAVAAASPLFVGDRRGPPHRHALQARLRVRGEDGVER